MTVVSIEFPETVLLATGRTRDEFIREGRQFLILKMFELGRLSAGKASELCGVSRRDFYFLASQWKVPIADLEPDEAADEFRDP